MQHYWDNYASTMGQKCIYYASTMSQLRIHYALHQVDPPENANFHTVSQKKYVFWWKKIFPKVAGL